MPEALTNFHFIRPAALLLAPLALLVWWLWQRRSDPLRGWRIQIDPELLHALADQPESRPQRHVTVLVGWIFAVLAITGPSWKPEPSPFADDATPLIVLLKAGVSMDTPDPAPSRIERAHLKIKDLAAARKGQPLGLIAYAGSAHLVLPPTKDTAAVATMAAEISTEIMPEPGDRPDLAIALAAELLADGNSTLLIITDTASSAASSLAASSKAAGSPFIQILAIAPPGTPINTLDPIARSLDADLVAMTTDDTDIARIVKSAARPPITRIGDGTERWQDGGYYLVPALTVLALLPFRREPRTKETNA
ncbi:MAG: VWA domain-containing protein [Akkermansiaceae bacterium]|nr:VWA domain-containing protein [Akkermansiaceae bacterium]